jgi:hypothetical protein
MAVLALMLGLLPALDVSFCNPFWSAGLTTEAGRIWHKVCRKIISFLMFRVMEMKGNCVFLCVLGIT